MLIVLSYLWSNFMVYGFIILTSYTSLLFTVCTLELATVVKRGTAFYLVKSDFCSSNEVIRDLLMIRKICGSRLLLVLSGATGLSRLAGVLG
jgi:hypothetical protein